VTVAERARRDGHRVRRVRRLPGRAVDGALVADVLAEPWFSCLKKRLPDVRAFDCHTHVGSSDSDGSRLSAEELRRALDVVGGRSVVFALLPPDHPDAPVGASVLELLDRHAAYLATDPAKRGPRVPGIHLIFVAAAVARTPGLPLPKPSTPVSPPGTDLDAALHGGLNR
jgi:hypothetical protein